MNIEVCFKNSYGRDLYTLHPHTSKAYLWLNTNLDVSSWDIGSGGIFISGECIVEICSEIHNDNLNFTGEIQ
jgi:hypothetical protein